MYVYEDGDERFRVANDPEPPPERRELGAGDVFVLTSSRSGKLELAGS